MNTNRLISECVAKGNCEYAFYSAYYGNSNFAPILSDLCGDVKPVSCSSEYAVKSVVNVEAVEFDSTLINRIHAAKSVENNVNQLSKEAIEHAKLLNEYQAYKLSVKQKIDGQENMLQSENIYAIYEDDIQQLIATWDAWYKEHNNDNSNKIKEKLIKMKEEEEETVSKLRQLLATELQRQKEQEQELKRQQAEQEHLKLIEAEKKRKEKEDFLVKKYDDLIVKKFLLSCHLTNEEAVFLENNRVKVHELKRAVFPTQGLYSNTYNDPFQYKLNINPRSAYGESYYYDAYDMDDGFDYHDYSYGYNPQSLRHMNPLDTQRYHKSRGSRGARGAMGAMGAMGSMGAMGAMGAMGGTYQVPEKAETYLVPIDFEPQPAPLIQIQYQTENPVYLSPNHLYKGELMAGIPNGKGILIAPASKEMIYKGSFVDGFYEGFGCLYQQNQEVIKGIFKKGILQEGRIINEDGSVYIGEVQGNQPEGEGTFVLPSGIWMKGQWKQGKPCGPMQFQFPECDLIVYDLDDNDDVTSVQIQFNKDSIYFRKIDTNEKIIPQFLYYFNGDIFIGETQQGCEPFKGYFYHFSKAQYTRMMLGEGSYGDNIVGISYENSPDGLTKSIHYERN